MPGAKSSHTLAICPMVSGVNVRTTPIATNAGSSTIRCSIAFSLWHPDRHRPARVQAQLLLQLGAQLLTHGFLKLRLAAIGGHAEPRRKPHLPPVIHHGQ